MLVLHLGNVWHMNSLKPANESEILKSSPRKVTQEMSSKNRCPPEAQEQ